MAWRWDKWSDHHALAVAWAMFMGALAVLLAGNPAAAKAAAPTVLFMLVLTGWLMPWWQGVVVAAGVSLLFTIAGLVELPLGIGLAAQAAVFYLFSLLFLATGRGSRRMWHHRARANALAERLDEARERQEFQARFFSMAAHEIGTPLTPLKLQVHALLMRPEAAPLEAGLLRIKRNVDRLERLSKDLLDSSRIQANTMQIAPVPVRLDAVLGEVVGACRAAAAEGEVELILDAPPVGAVVDPDRIGQVVWNLASNALKFTPPGGHVRVSLRQEDDLRITVEDDGMGMAPEQVEALFRPFAQFHKERVRGGTGLGLFVSKGICLAHGGDLVASSNGIGQGSRFVAVLPLRPIPRQEAEPVPVPA